MIDKITAENLRWAYRKLKAHYFFQQKRIDIIDKIVHFEGELETQPDMFQCMHDYLNGLVDSSNYVNLSSDVIGILKMPKKDAFSQKHGKPYIDSYNDFIDLPISFLILDVLFSLNLIEALEKRNISSFAYSPSTYFARTNDRLRNNFLFEHYWNGYRKWAKIPEHSYLQNEDSERTIIKIDLEKCFYHASFNFRSLIDRLKIANDISFIMGSIYRLYSTIILKERYNQSKSPGESVLPVGLLSSPLILNFLLHDVDKSFHSVPGVISYGRYVDDIILVIEEYDPHREFDSFVRDSFAKIVGKGNGKYRIEKCGMLLSDLPINDSKIQLRHLSNGDMKDIDWSVLGTPSFIDDFSDFNFDEMQFRADDVDLDIVRSFINTQRIKNEEKFLRSIKNYSPSELLNIHEHWFDIFRMLSSKTDYEAIREEIESSIKNAIDSISSFDETMETELRSFLNFELNFAIEKCLMPASELAYMLNVTDKDVQNAIPLALKDDIFIPFHFSIAHISYFLSMRALGLKDSLKEETVKFYKRLNRLENIDDFLIELASLRKNGSFVELQMPDDEVKEFTIALGCLSMEAFHGNGDIDKYVAHFGRLGKYSLADLLIIADEAKKSDARYLVLPEFAVKKDDLLPLVKYCERKKISLICGVEHFEVAGHAHNITCVFDALTHLVFLKPKNYLPLKEKQIIEKKGFSYSEPDEKLYLLIEIGDFAYSTMTCFEATNIKDRAMLAGQIDCLFLPAYNPDTSYFSNIVDSFCRDASIYIAQANCNAFGDSKIRRPSKSAMADVVKIKGGINNYCVVGALELKNLHDAHDEYLKAEEAVSDYSNDNFKPLSAGNTHKPS